MSTKPNESLFIDQRRVPIALGTIAGDYGRECADPGRWPTARA